MTKTWRDRKIAFLFATAVRVPLRGGKGLEAVRDFQSDGKTVDEDTIINPAMIVTWLAGLYRIARLEGLLALPGEVIAPAEEKVKALEERRRIIEAELIKPS